MLVTINLVCTPDGSGRYTAILGNHPVARRTRTPFYSAARALLKEGVPAAAPLIMRHRGSDTVALQGTVGGAAKWTVRERDDDIPRVVPYRTFPSVDEG